MKEFLNRPVWFYLKILNIVMWSYIIHIDYKKYKVLKKLNFNDNYTEFQKEILNRAVLIAFLFVTITLDDL